MLTFDKVGKKYNKSLFTNLTFKLKPKETIYIPGPSGAGKTTITRLILGLEKPDNGKIINTFRKIACVFQEDRLLENLSLLDNISLVSEENYSSIEKLLLDLGLLNLEAKANTLSGGMKRKLAIARALAYQGDLLILDEPFTGLDKESKKQASKVIKDRHKKALILISHDIGDKELLGINNEIKVF